MMDEESVNVLESFKKKHRYSKSLILRSLAKFYGDKENELLTIMEGEIKDMIESEDLKYSEALLDVLTRAQIHQLEELEKSSCKIVKIKEELQGNGGLDKND